MARIPIEEMEYQLLHLDAARYISVFPKVFFIVANNEFSSRA